MKNYILEISDEPIHPAGEGGVLDPGLPENFENLVALMKRASYQSRGTIKKEDLDFFIEGLERLATRHNLF